MQAATMLAVKQLAPSIEYYVDKLGFELVSQMDHIAALRLDSYRLYLVTHSDPTPDKPSVTLTSLNAEGKTPAVLVFWVPDCEKVYTDLLAKGISFLAPPSAPGWGGQRCFAVDPDGYLIEIEDDPNSAFRVG